MDLIKKIFTLFLLLGVALDAKMVVVSSVAPVSSLIKSIAGDSAKVITVVEAGKSPHTYEPKVSLMRELESAKLYFAVGVEFEKSWLKKFQNQNQNLKIIHLDENITKILMSVGNKMAREDPHIWLSPKNMKIMAQEILEALISVDQNRSKLYKQNYKKSLKEIDELDKNIKKTLAKVPKGSKFMVFHPSWGYFAKDYHLLQLPIEIEGKEPKPSQLIKLIKIAKKDNIKAIIVQPEFSDKSAKILAKELNAKVVKLSSLSPDWQGVLLKLAKTIAEGFVD
jgi:zinc transport system substrate-binding protein